MTTHLIVNANKLFDADQWKASIRREHATAHFYIEVDHGVEFLVAYDSKDAEKEYGRWRRT